MKDFELFFFDKKNHFENIEINVKGNLFNIYLYDEFDCTCVRDIPIDKLKLLRDMINDVLELD